MNMESMQEKIGGSQKTFLFEDIAERYHKDIINFFYRLLGNRFEAEDQAQNAFVKAYLKFDTLKDVNKVRSWLFSIAKNTAIDFFRKNKNREVAVDTDVLKNLSTVTGNEYIDQVVRKHIAHSVDNIVDNLNSRDRMIIKLLYYEGFSYEEICGILHVNKNTLKSQLRRARRILLKEIEARGIMDNVLSEETH
ncbi:MAG: RNA polymerase sigma-70 factor, ECF subfamily [Parcubacteria group bacterium Licking1014_17]|nr:MAG: RNA polymerase sigma-70 factor, ECF subfamily [Parcubacteria group bacterium Licking1014_17]